MCSKADTNASNRLLRCGHRRLFFMLKRHRSSSAQTSHEQRVDAESACPETATLWLGHQPGIGDAAGKPVPPGAGFGTVRRRQDFGRQSRRLFPRNLRGKVKNWLRITVLNSRAARFRRRPKIQSSKNDLVVGENNCRSNTAYKKVSPAAKP